MDRKEILRRVNSSEAYDMKMEFGGFGRIDRTQPNIIKVEKYKEYNNNVSVTEKVKCNACLLAVSIYKEAYQFLREFAWRKKEITVPNYLQCKYLYELYLGDEIYVGDTMNTFSQMQKHIENSFPLIFGMEEEIRKRRESIWRELEIFAGLCHSAGNQIPVPHSLVTLRAGGYGNGDSWKLNMQKIYQAYQGRQKEGGIDDKPLMELLNPTGENKKKQMVSNCKAWLERFGTFNCFVNANFLEAFCDEDEDGDYLPKIFWAGDVWKTDVSSRVQLPNTELEMLKYLREINQMIRKRNQDIVNALLDEN